MRSHPELHEAESLLSETAYGWGGHSQGSHPPVWRCDLAMSRAALDTTTEKKTATS